VLDGCRFDQAWLVVLDGHTLGEQLRGQAASHFHRLPLAVGTPRTHKLDLPH